VVCGQVSKTMAAVMEELQSRSDSMADEVFESMDDNKVSPATLGRMLPWQARRVMRDAYRRRVRRTAWWTAVSSTSPSPQPCSRPRPARSHRSAAVPHVHSPSRRPVAHAHVRAGGDGECGDAAGGEHAGAGADGAEGDGADQPSRPRAGQQPAPHPMLPPTLRHVCGV
jgi:hypothetical protein